MVHNIKWFKMGCIWWFIVYSLYKKRARRYNPYHLLLIWYIPRSHYFVLICSNLISIPETNSNPLEFDWNSVDSELLLNKCIVTLIEMYSITCGCKKKMHSKMSVQQGWHFMRRILQVHWRRMLYLSWPIDSVRHRISYANINVFSMPHFPIYGQNPRTYTQKYVSEKTRIFPCFTQSDIFLWLDQKTTHHWARVIDIILKTNNCKEVFS